MTYYLLDNGRKLAYHAPRESWNNAILWREPQVRRGRIDRGTEEQTTMKIVLSAFHYYFTLEGSSGGLFSIMYDFKPRPEPGEGVDELKTATKRLMQTYADMLESLYGDVIEGGKEPIL